MICLLKIHDVLDFSNGSKQINAEPCLSFRRGTPGNQGMAPFLHCKATPPPEQGEERIERMVKVCW